LPEAKDTLPRLRQLLAWIKTNNRMPSAAELYALGAAGDLSSAQPGSKEFAEEVRYFEDLIAFLEQHSRFPRDRISGPPFRWLQLSLRSNRLVARGSEIQGTIHEQLAD
jgi:hypothetical protein